ncbi:UDP-N-acetyl-D-glucosamine dehydrogenase [Candidatus Peregrinibacteria bacterium CG_4_10_14_0_2_um_filter_43_11]|nr:MAG: UDP-N-acetyl-D-glucosamine dehydrogenase [Candidatus Peregrinibacteria bacterium CG_4_10_14_0_2_um_filter_43_11]
MNLSKKKVCIVGLGYVGFPLLCAIAKNGQYTTCGFDISQKQIGLIQKGVPPIDDKQAAEDMQTVQFEVSTDPAIMQDSDFFVVCVPTPVNDDHLPDLSPVKSAIIALSPYVENGSTIILESTVNPGVSEEIVIPLLEEKTGMKVKINFHVAHCPERINPGDKKWNVYNIPRNIGATTKEACKMVADFYRSFLSADINEMTSLKVAEATKIIENTFRDINIAYVNELAKSFSVLGIDLLEVMSGASNKPFAFMPHFPGCGVGGHCIPVDPYYLIERAQKSGFEHQFLKLAREINNSMPAYTISQLKDALSSTGNSIDNSKIGVLGIAYKGNVADKRESPALKIIKLLQGYKAELFVFDPYFPEESNVNSIKDLLEKVDAVIIATEHEEFKQITPQNYANTGIKVVIDGKNIYHSVDFSQTEIILKGIGYG